MQTAHTADELLTWKADTKEPYGVCAAESVASLPYLSPPVAREEKNSTQNCTQHATVNE